MQPQRIDDQIVLESELAPGGIIVYYADGDEEILHVNQYVIDLFECESFEDFMQFVGGSFKGFVHATDVDAAEDSIWGQVAGRDGFDHVYYQIQTKSGRLVSIDDYGRLIEKPGERPYFYVFVAEMDRGSSIDWLTGLAGIERFRDITELELPVRAEHGEPMAIVSFDLMGMKAYNSVYGRKRGDQLLCGFAKVLRQQFGSESCCRADADSFLAKAPMETVQDSIDAVFRDFALIDNEVVPPVAAGACLVEPDEDVVIAIDRAISACNSDVRTWGSHVTWFTDSMRTDDLLRVHVLDHLDEAIKEGWIRPYYQGIVRSASGALCGMEALARWDDPKYGTLLPKQFVPILEEAGSLTKLDMYMVEHVLADIERRQQLGAPIVPVSVNMSLSEIDGTHMANGIVNRVKASGLAHELLRVEFVESASTKHPELLREQIRVLHDAGIEVWMDHFGSGYSSLNLLGDFEFDLIKLDADFLHAGRLARSEIVVDGIIRASKRMGIRVLAEGVEDLEDAERLASMGCDMLQGFLFSRPQPVVSTSHDVRTGSYDLLEPSEEASYWNAVSSVSLADLASNGEGKGVSETSVSSLPVGVLERRKGAWRMLRLNDSLEDLLVARSVMPAGLSSLRKGSVELEFDENLNASVRRCESSRSWERISGTIERGSGFQFYVCPLAACSDARAYVVTSTPTMLGSGLGTYGDVPVAYAVLRVLPNASGTSAADVEYVYANDLYCKWGNLGEHDFTGETLLQVAGAGGLRWLPLCYRAAVLGEEVHDTYYSPEAGHWLSVSIMQSPIAKHCVFAFTIVDAEQHERAKLEAALDTSYSIIDITDTLNELGYDAAMERLLEEMSKVIHPDRLYILERGPKTTTNTFEWCAPGIEPKIDKLRNVSNDAFATWDSLFAHDSCVTIPDVDALRLVDPDLHAELTGAGITRMLAVPFYESGELLGFLGANNYVLDDRLDIRRLLETVSSFVSARMANRRLVKELEQAGSHDALTGLLNRRGIDDAMAQRMKDGLSRPFVLALLDVDDFKTINDLYGHDVGDEALRVLAKELTGIFPPTAVIGRNGGDEILTAIFNDDALKIDEYLSKLTGSEIRFGLGDKSYSISVSVGYAWCPPNAHDLKPTYTKADEALYAVKLGGKSGYRGWSSELKETPQRSMLGFTTRDLANGMPLAMMAHRPDGKLLFANEGLARMVGYASLSSALAEKTDEVLYIWDFVHPHDADALRKKIDRLTECATTGEDLNTTLRIVTKDGKVLEVTYRARKIASEGMDPALYAYMVERD